MLPNSGVRSTGQRTGGPHSSETPAPLEPPASSAAPQPNAAPAAAHTRPTSTHAARQSDVVPGFLSLVASIHQQVQAAAAAQDWPLAERLAHSLNHTACSYGFHQISSLALRVTQAAAAADLSGLRSAVDQLEQCRREATRLTVHQAATMLCGAAQPVDGVAGAAATRAAGA